MFYFNFNNNRSYLLFALNVIYFDFCQKKKNTYTVCKTAQVAYFFVCLDVVEMNAFVQFQLVVFFFSLSFSLHSHFQLLRLFCFFFSRISSQREIVSLNSNAYIDCLHFAHKQGDIYERMTFKVTVNNVLLLIFFCCFFFFCLCTVYTPLNRLPILEKYLN